MRRGKLPLGLLACLIAVTPFLPSPVAAAAPAPATSSSGSSLWTTSQVQPTEVVVSRLPAAAPADLRAAAPFSHRQLLVRDPAAYAAAKLSPKGTPGMAIPQQVGARVAAPQVPFVSTFTGVGYVQEVNQFGSDAAVEPPDTQLAAGSTSLMELVNVVGQVYTKSGSPIGSMFLLRSWFGFPSTYFPADPHVVFDAASNRWYATALGFNAAGASEVILAVSTSSNPAGAWRRYVVYRSSTLLCDQPKLGYSSNKFLIACSDYSPSTFIGAVMIVASKTQALAGATVTVGSTSPNNTLFGLVPAQNADAGEKAYIVFNEDDVHAGLITVTGDPATGLSHVLLSLANVLMTLPTSTPPKAQQNGSTSLIDTGDQRFMQAVLRGGEIWTSTTTGCTPSGDTAVRACMKVLEIGVAGATNDQDTTTGIVGKYLYYPTVGLDANGNVAIDYSLSSTTDYPSHGAMIEPLGQTTPTDRGILQAGSGPYTGTRWGDYGAAATDPIEPTRVWVAGEYSVGNQVWGTGVGAIDFSSLQLSPTGVGFGAQLLGTDSGAQGLTVTNTSDFPVTVTSALNSGDTAEFHSTLNNCASVVLPSLGTCTAQFVFSPTTAGDKQARFNVSGLHYGPLSLVLSGTGVGPACTSTAVSSDVPSPQNIGTTVTLNATSAGCPNPNPEYRFYLRSPAKVWTVVQDFGPSSSFVWNTATSTPGTYLIGVWVKDAQSVAPSYDAYAFGTFTLQFPSCASVNLASDAASPQASGITVNFTATPAGCPSPTFQWWVRNAASVWSIVVPFASSTDTFAWNTTGLPNGTYQIGVWARQAGSTKSYEAFAFVTFTVTPTITGSTHCGAVDVAASPLSPQATTTSVTLTASVFGCDTPQYKWWVRDTAAVWHVVQNYPGTSTFVWTGTRPAGTYLLGVWVRQSGSSAAYEAYSFITYTLTIPAAAQSCTSVGISPDAVSPQAPGATITFTASALGCSVPNYRFFVAPPSGVFASVQAYGAGNTYVWHTNGLAPGPYQVGVWARRSGSTASYEAFAFITFQLQVAFTPCTTLAVSTSPGQIISSGPSNIMFTAVTSSCPSPTYKFYLRSGSGAFVVVQSYGATNTFTLGVNGRADGPWTLEVLSKDAASPAAYDSFAFTDFTIN